MAAKKSSGKGKGKGTPIKSIDQAIAVGIAIGQRNSTGMRKGSSKGKKK